MIAGLDLSRSYPAYGDAMLLCVTEQHSRDEIDRFVALLRDMELESEVL